jgi:hypothetical protein
MLARLAVLLHSKIAVALVGVVCVDGAGAVVATTSGATSHLPHAFFAQNGSQHGEGAHTSADDDASGTPSGVGAHKEQHGVVATVNSAGSSFVHTVTREDTKTSSPLTVIVNADTEFEGVTNSFAALKAGMEVEFGGASQADGSFLAAKIERGTNAENDNDEDDNHQQAEASGAIATIGGSSFTPNDEHGTVTITVTNTTTFEGVEGIANLKGERRVKVRGAQQSDGSSAARHVQVDDSGHGGD